MHMQRKYLTKDALHSLPDVWDSAAACALPFFEGLITLRDPWYTAKPMMERKETTAKAEKNCLELNVLDASMKRTVPLKTTLRKYSPSWSP